MEKTDIIKKAIEKAHKNGWLNQYEKITCVDFQHPPHIGCFGVKDKGNHHQGLCWDINELVFSHDFAKAFWGEKNYYGVGYDKACAWQYHIQQLSLSENRLEYISGFVENK